MDNISLVYDNFSEYIYLYIIYTNLKKIFVLLLQLCTFFVKNQQLIKCIYCNSKR